MHNVVNSQDDLSGTSDMSADIVTLTKTWLSNTICDTELSSAQKPVSPKQCFIAIPKGFICGKIDISTGLEYCAHLQNH